MEKFAIGKELFACQCGDDLCYVVRVYRGHLFRESWEGDSHLIESADDSDVKTAQAFGVI